MSRWEPNALGRLEAAALDLYTERGYDATTVAEIAKRAGLTERTFFRYFADKREVLFAGAGTLQDLLVRTLDGALDRGAGPMQAVAAALDAAAVLLQGRAEHACRRQAVITATTELRERELIKMATLAGALADRLRLRNVPEPAASLTAEAGIAVFRIAFERWAVDVDGPDLARRVRESLEELRAVTAAG